MIRRAGGESQSHYGAAANMASSCSIESGTADLGQTERLYKLECQLDDGGPLAPLEDRLHRMLSSGASADAKISRRVGVVNMATRQLHLPHFVADGSYRLRLPYANRRKLMLGSCGMSRRCGQSLPMFRKRVRKKLRAVLARLTP